MEKEINKALISINYEIFIKKCIGNSPFERYKLNSDLMSLLLNTSKEDVKFNSLFEQIQENLVSALKILHYRTKIFDSSNIDNLIHQINTAIKLEQLITCIENGLNLLKK